MTTEVTQSRARKWGTITAGSANDEPAPIEDADGGDGEIGDSELLDPVSYWRGDKAVPAAGGRTSDQQPLLARIERRQSGGSR